MKQLFKNAIIYRLMSEMPAAHVAEERMSPMVFQACGPTQDKSVGFVPPRQDHGALLESVGGQWIIRVMIETKSVPATAVLKKAQEAADHIEATTGRKPGRKEMKALREDALMALLTQAFPKQVAVTVWIDRAAGLLALDTASWARAEDVMGLLVRAFDNLTLSLLNTTLAPQSAMTQWLLADAAEWPEEFAVERECELRSHDEEKSVVRFTRHNLITDEVRRHISEGKLPERLAMSWAGRLGFVLDTNLVLRRLEFLDVVFGDGENEESGFDADVAITTGELGRMLPELFEALGGLAHQEGGAK